MVPTQTEACPSAAESRFGSFLRSGDILNLILCAQSNEIQLLNAPESTMARIWDLLTVKRMKLPFGWVESLVFWIECYLQIRALPLEIARIVCSFCDLRGY